jgi:hypothetical protein
MRTWCCVVFGKELFRDCSVPRYRPDARRMLTELQGDRLGDPQDRGSAATLGLQNRGSSAAGPGSKNPTLTRQALGFSDDRVFGHYGVVGSAAGRSDRQLNEIRKSDRT